MPGMDQISRVAHVLAARRAGASYFEIAKKLGVCVATVANICKRKTHAEAATWIEEELRAGVPLRVVASRAQERPWKAQ